METVWQVRTVTGEPYRRKGVRRRIEELGGRMLDRDGRFSRCYKPAPGIYVSSGDRLHVAADVPRNRLEEAAAALAGAFVDVDGRSLVWSVMAWGPDGEGKVWPPERGREAWQEDPDAWKPDNYDGPGAGPAGGGLFAEGGF